MAHQVNPVTQSDAEPMLPDTYVLGRPVTAPVGQDFLYNAGVLTLLSAAVRKATGQGVDEFCAHNSSSLWASLGPEWLRVKGGDSDAGSGLRLRPRDMAKIGQLVLAGGRWNDRQIVSKAWIDASTTPHVSGTGSILADLCGGSDALSSMGAMSNRSQPMAAGAVDPHRS